MQQEKAKLALTSPGLKGEKEDVRLKKEKGGVNTYKERSHMSFASQQTLWGECVTSDA